MLWLILANKIVTLMMCSTDIVTTIVVDEPSNRSELACPIRVKYHDPNMEDYGQPFSAVLLMQQHCRESGRLTAMLSDLKKKCRARSEACASNGRQLASSKITDLFVDSLISSIVLR